MVSTGVAGAKVTGRSVTDKSDTALGVPVASDGDDMVRIGGSVDTLTATDGFVGDLFGCALPE